MSQRLFVDAHGFRKQPAGEGRVAPHVAIPPACDEGV
jgi:hypothetical protein